MINLDIKSLTEDDSMEIVRAIAILKILQEECPKIFKKVDVDYLTEEGKYLETKKGKPKRVNIRVFLGKLSRVV